MSISRRSLVAVLLPGAMAFATLTSATIASATPGWIRLSYVHDPSTNMTAAWNTANNVGTNVRWGTSPNNLTNKATGTSAQANTALGYVHEAEMTGLTPKTQYYYQVGDDTDGWSAVFSFKSAPTPSKNCAKFKFVYLGDNRPDKAVGLGDNWTSIFAEATGESPLFVMDGGDLVYNGEDNGQWVDFLGWTGPPAQYVPFMPTMGNHDDDAVQGNKANYNKLFALPRSSGPGSSGTEDYYYFEVGNAIFVSINTQLFTSGNTFKDQATWLDDVLTKHPKRWKFVMMHHPIYTGSFLGLTHGPNEKGQNAALVAVIDKHHVDMVLQSHNHWYERFAISNCTLAGNSGSLKPCPVGANNYAGGTVYLTSGGAGALTIPGCGSADSRPKCDTKHHYVVFDIDDGHLHMETWRSSQQTIGDSPSNHKKIDELDINKPPATCGTGTPDAGTPDSGQADATVPDAAEQDSAATDTGAQQDTGTTQPTEDAGGTQPTVDAGHHQDSGSPDGGQQVSANPAAANDGGCSCSQAGSPAPSPTRWGILFGFLAGGLITFLRTRSRARKAQLRSV